MIAASIVSPGVRGVVGDATGRLTEDDEEDWDGKEVFCHLGRVVVTRVTMGKV